MKNQWKGFTLLGIACLLLFGCGDTNLFKSVADDKSSDAKISAALEDINRGNYAAAIAALEQMDPNDPQVKKYLASAYIGATGFDTLKLIETAGNQADGTTNFSDGGIFTTVNDLLNLGNGTAEENMALLTKNIETAKKALDLLAPSTSDITSLSEEAQFQAGLYAAVQTIYITEFILEGQDPATLNETEITTRVNTNFAANSADLERSLSLVVAGRDTLIKNLADPSESNDLQDSLDEFLRDIGYDDNELTASELSAYVINNK